MAGLLLLYPHRWNIPTSLTKPNAINPIRYLLGIPLLGIIKKTRNCWSMGRFVIRFTTLVGYNLIELDYNNKGITQSLYRHFSPTKQL